MKKMLTELYKLNRRVKCSLVQFSSEERIWIFTYRSRFMRPWFKHVMTIGQRDGEALA